MIEHGMDGVGGGGDCFSFFSCSAQAGIIWQELNQVDFQLHGSTANFEALREKRQVCNSVSLEDIRTFFERQVK